MGQINCQCQYGISHQEVTHSLAKSNIKSEVNIDGPDTTQVYTKLILKSKNCYIDIGLMEGTRTSFGTTQDCMYRRETTNGNSFKCDVRYQNRNAYIRDCGVGLGIFLQKKKLIVNADSTERLFSIDDQFVMIKIKQSQQILFTVFDGEKLETGIFEKKGQHQIKLSDSTLVLKRQVESKQYSIRRNTRK